VSADLDALDRGIIEAGGLAAQALSRVAEVEQRLARLEQAARMAYALGWEAGLRRGRDGPPPEPRRHLTAIEGGEQ